MVNTNTGEIIDSARGVREDVTQRISDEGLLGAYASAQELILSMQKHSLNLEAEIMRRMAQRGSIAIPSEVYVCEQTARMSYNQASFTPLKEILGESDLKTCFVPSHTETIEVHDRWDTVKVKALAKRYGAEAQNVVNAAGVRGLPTLRFKRR